jgi:hypothetical protein
MKNDVGEELLVNIQIFFNDIYIYIYIYIRKYAHFEILKTIFKGQMLCQNARIKVLDSFFTRINVFMNKH